MELGIDILAMLFAAAFIAAFIDAIAGGGGLITIPALLMTGMPPAMALGTNKLQAFGGALSASIYFLRKSAVNFSFTFSSGSIAAALKCFFTAASSKLSNSSKK